MNYRRLGGAGVKVSEIGLGGWLTFGNAVDLEQGRKVLKRALDKGVNFLDSANAYARGKCEEAWGELLKDVRRSSIVLATKVFFPMDDGPNDRGLSRKHIFEQCEASLRRLRTSYIDLYQCHRFDDQTPLEETVSAMNDLVRQGKVLYWGFSEWSAEQIRQCLEACGGRYEKPRSSQPQYNALHRVIEAEVMPLCATAGIGQVVWSPLAQGILSGKYRPQQAPPPDSRAADIRQNQFIKARVGDHGLLEKVQRAAALAREAGCTPSQLALAWILRRGEISSCIIGATRPEQVDENVEASGIKPEADLLDRYEKALE